MNEDEWLIEFHSVRLLNEYLIKQQEFTLNMRKKISTVKNMTRAFIHLDKILTTMEKCDLIREYLFHVRRTTEKDTACYGTC